MKKSLKERSQRTTVKASLLPPLKVHIDGEVARNALGAILAQMKTHETEGIKLGMKQAQRAIRRQQAGVVFVDSLLPRVVLGFWNFSEIFGIFSNLIFRLICRLQEADCD